MQNINFYIHLFSIHTRTLLDCVVSYFVLACVVCVLSCVMFTLMSDLYIRIYICVCLSGLNIIFFVLIYLVWTIT
jgi:hypothetical protein